MSTWFIVACFWLQSVMKIRNTSKSFLINMLMETYLCFHRLENVGSQQLYRALSRVASMVRKCFVFHYHLVTYGMDVSETLTTFWSVVYQLATFAEVFVAKCVYPPLQIQTSPKIKIRCCVRRLSVSSPPLSLLANMLSWCWLENV